MQIMKKAVQLLFLMALLITLSACSGQTQPPAPQPSLAVKLTPFQTMTSTPTITPTPEGLPANTPVPTLTATPQTYEMKLNDTFYSVAEKFGVTVEELQAANPEVHHLYINIGTQLLIPAAKATPAATSAATPITYNLTFAEPYCFPSLTGGLHCFALITNEEEQTLSSLSAEFTLSDSESGEVIHQQADLPLAHLSPGESLPFYLFFPPPVFSQPQVAVTLVSASEARLEDGAAVSAAVEELKVTIAVDGASAGVSGTIAFEGSEPPGEVVLLAVAYDASGRVVGIRRGTLHQEWGGSDTPTFNITVFSGGGVIDHVLVFASAEN